MSLINSFLDTINDPNHTRTLIGVGLSVTGNILISLALSIQKFAHNRIQARIQLSEEEALLNNNDSTDIEMTENLAPKPKNKNYLKSRWWWLGFFLMNLGEVGNFLAYGFAPASTVAPLGTVGLITNAITAPAILGERFRARDFFGIILAMAGAVSVVLTSKNTESEIPIDGLITIFLRTKVLIYCGGSIGAVLFLLSLPKSYTKRYVFIDLLIVAIFGGFTVLATKAISSLLNSSSDVMFSYPITYAIIVILIGTGVFQIKFLNKALQIFDSTVVIPTQFVLFTLSAVTGSAILFDEFESFTTIQYFSFISGCLLTFLGVYCIASERNDADQEEGPLLNSLISTPQSRPSSILSLPHDQFNDDFDSRRSSSHRYSKLPINGHRHTSSNSQLTGLSSIGLAYSYGSS